MSILTATIVVTNQFDTAAEIIIYHWNSYLPEPYEARNFGLVPPGEKAGPFLAHFPTGVPAEDNWAINVSVPSGPQEGVWVSYGPLFSAWKENMMYQEDANGELTFTVSPQNGFSIALNSSTSVADMQKIAPYTRVKNVFVLMLENRSFDHMLGFSGITGNDAVTGQPTTINGLTGTESNSYDGITYTVGNTAPVNMLADPGHEFLDTLQQLTGETAYTPGVYPPINNSGFIADFLTSPSPQEGHPPAGAENEVMLGYEPAAIPWLSQLASNFAVCDNWYSAMPGPTWPNRFFVYAGTSGGLDDSPSSTDIKAWEAVDGDGVAFEHGSLFDLLPNPVTTPDAFQTGWALFHVEEASEIGGSFPIAAALQNVSVLDANSFADFQPMLLQPYNYRYTFIEPNYGDVSTNYQGGCSQHPMDSVVTGDQMIQSVFGALATSPLFEQSLLVITYDEHGGFYDHVAPPGGAVPPGDTLATPFVENIHGFDFTQYGVRVPAVVVSPLIPQNTIDHRLYDHSSVPATVGALFGLPHLTNRDAAAANLTSLLSLETARKDCLKALKVESKLFEHLNAEPRPVDPAKLAQPLPERGNLLGFLFVAHKTHLELEPENAVPIKAEYNAISTRGQARDYLRKVANKLKAHKATRREQRTVKKG